jgi:hypothetical protein
MIKRTKSTEFDFDSPATTIDVMQFLQDVPSGAGIVIKTWEGYQSKVTEIQSIEFDSETNTVTIL